MIDSVEEELRGAKSAGTNGLQTDADIINRGGKAADQPRTLQKTDNAWLEGTTAGLDASAASGSWDQFRVNKEKFGVESSYDENL
ncbi:hypothetical protein GUF51_04110, partial [Xanthomonas citri pv. citri]|nr:hypothetical protein [Xanthomonas citri pv. citri]